MPASRSRLQSWFARGAGLVWKVPVAAFPFSRVISYLGGVDMSDAGSAGEHVPEFVLTLFIAGNGIHAQRAVANLKQVCDRELDGRYQLEIVDVLQEPQRAEDARVLATPTLIKQLPPPLRRVVGDLSDKDKLLVGLQVQRTDDRPNPKEPAA